MTECCMTGEDCQKPKCQGDSDDLCDFSQWIDTLKVDVIQGEYGYESGEFTVYPDHWHPLYVEGLTPAQAFKRALDAHRS